MKKSKAIDRHLDFKKGEILTKKKLKVLVPKFYELTGLTHIEDTVKTLGIFKILVENTEYIHMLMMSSLEMVPVNITDEVYEGEEYLCLHFDPGSVFIASRDPIRDPMYANAVYSAFIGLGKLPSFLTYDEVHVLFDKTKMLCNVNLGVNRSIFEIIYAHMFRDANDPFTFYRNTAMKNPPLVVPLQKISHGPTSSSGRIIGSYTKEGTVADLVTENTAPSEIENILRA